MFGLLLLSFFQLKLPDTVKGQANAFITVTAETSGKAVKFVAIDPGLSVFPSNLLSDPKTTVVVGGEGRYRLLAYTSINDIPSDPVIVIVQIGSPVIPTPPTPPAPVPSSDKLRDDIASLWSASSEAGKIEKKNALASVYRRAAQACQSPDFKSAGELFLSLQSEADRDVPRPALMQIRERFSQEFKKALPLDQPALTQKNRDDGAAIFLKASAILDGLQ